MTLASLIDSDLTDVFLNTDEFGEAVTVLPAAGGGARSVTAVATEGPKAAIETEKHHDLKRWTVALLFKNDATTGLTTVVRGDAIRYRGRKWVFHQVRHVDDAGIEVEWITEKVISAGKINIGL